MTISRRAADKLIGESKRLRCKKGEACVRIAAIADLPTRYGKFSIVGFTNNLDDKEHAALVKGDVIGEEDVLVRLHSECLTGDTLSSLRCDCGKQLNMALKMLGAKSGVLLYMRQEGRGIGLTNKIKAYRLEQEGYDTYQANKMLGFNPDERDYDIAADMLRLLHIKSVVLMTNNPEKIKDLSKHGIKVTGRIALNTKPNRYNEKYLDTKKRWTKQMLDRYPQVRRFFR